jgi:hypothetical protein
MSNHQGFFCKDNEEEIQKFFKANPTFKAAKVPEVKAIRADFPYKNFFSFAIGLSKTIPKLF